MIYYRSIVLPSNYTTYPPPSVLSSLGLYIYVSMTSRDNQYFDKGESTLDLRRRVVLKDPFANQLPLSYLLAQLLQETPRTPSWSAGGHQFFLREPFWRKTVLNSAPTVPSSSHEQFRKKCTIKCSVREFRKKKKQSPRLPPSSSFLPSFPYILHY